MALVKQSIIETWYKDENHFIFNNFDYIFKNPVWDKSDSKPGGFSVCPYFWMSVLVGFCLVRICLVPTLLISGKIIKGIAAVLGPKIVSGENALVHFLCNIVISKFSPDAADELKSLSDRKCGVSLLFLVVLTLFSGLFFGIFCLFWGPFASILTLGYKYAIVYALYSSLILATPICFFYAKNVDDGCKVVNYIRVLATAAIVSLFAFHPWYFGTMIGFFKSVVLWIGGLFALSGGWLLAMILTPIWGIPFILYPVGFIVLNLVVFYFFSLEKEKKILEHEVLPVAKKDWENLFTKIFYTDHEIEEHVAVRLVAVLRKHELTYEPHIAKFSLSSLQAKFCRLVFNQYYDECVASGYDPTPSRKHFDIHSIVLATNFKGYHAKLRRHVYCDFLEVAGFALQESMCDYSAHSVQTHMGTFNKEIEDTFENNFLAEYKLELEIYEQLMKKKTASQEKWDALCRSISGFVGKPFVIVGSIVKNCWVYSTVIVKAKKQGACPYIFFDKKETDETPGE